MSDTLMKLWEHEKTAPRWFRDICETDRFSDDQFEAWKDSFDRIYEFGDGDAALYVKRDGELAQIHFSAVRKFDAGEEFLEELSKAKADIFANGAKTIAGWVAKRNRGLRRICEAMGMRYYGFSKLKGESHGKVIEWMCYQVFA